MCEGKGQHNSEKQEVQAKLLLVGKVLPGMLLKCILRTPYALSQSLCQQSNRKELFPRRAVSQAHGYVSSGATQAPWPVPAVGSAGIKQEQTPCTQQTPECHPSQSESMLRFQTPWRRPRHTSIHWALTQAWQGTPQFSLPFRLGLLALDSKVQQTACRK